MATDFLESTCWKLQKRHRRALCSGTFLTCCVVACVTRATLVARLSSWMGTASYPAAFAAGTWLKSGILRSAAADRGLLRLQTDSVAEVLRAAYRSCCARAPRLRNDRSAQALPRTAPGRHPRAMPGALGGPAFRRGPQ